jgi:hypothetical protein
MDIVVKILNPYTQWSEVNSVAVSLACSHSECCGPTLCFSFGCVFIFLWLDLWEFLWPLCSALVQSWSISFQSSEFF